MDPSDPLEPECEVKPDGEVEPESEAERLLAEYLRRKEAGEELDFEAFCRQHPALSDAAGHPLGDWEQVAELLDAFGAGRAASPGDAGDESVRARALVERIARARRSAERYSVREELASGGMGRISRAWDHDLQREVALKTALSEAQLGLRPPSSRVRSLRLARFLEEAQVTGQLDHPGIVPVHELGVDDEGRPFFALKLVKGRDLRALLDEVHAGKQDWGQARALGVLLKVCEAMAFAHEHGVVHRDLKPANIMVGRHGETYVMDWGLARVQGRRDTHDLRLRPQGEDGTRPVLVDRSDLVEPTPRSPLVTEDGEVVGTPNYMPPEQARGELERIGPASDVYSVGAILYELLGGTAPYREAGRSEPAWTVVRRIRAGPPTPIERLAPGEPPELVAICEKAMAREPEARYRDMVAMAEDLRAFLEHRVVRAWRTGALIELRKWVERNRAVAALMLALLAVVAGAGFLSAWLQGQRERERFDRLARAYVDEAERSWPVHPDSVPRIERWLEGARELCGALPRLRAELAALRERGRPPEPDAAQAALEASGLDRLLANQSRFLALYPGMIEELRERVRSESVPDEERVEARRLAAVFELELEEARARRERLLRRARRAQPWAFDDPALAARHVRLRELVANLEELAHPEDGAIRRASALLDEAADLRRRSIEEHERAWAAAIRSIADPDECPLYEGRVRLAPQLGLVPLEQDFSGLWEFWLVPSGERPERGPEGSWELRPETGLVMVLVPGGRFTMGVQGSEPQAPNYDPALAGAAALPNPPHEVELAPYFLAKYEMTQGQWARLSGELPSTYASGQRVGQVPWFTRTHPVESVAWDDCDRLLRRWGLGLPTQAQWERAARAGFDGPYGEFERLADLPSQLNCADETFARTNPGYGILSGHDDGWVFHRPVDGTLANAWGLFGMLGNVSEWTRDWTDPQGVGLAETPYDEVEIVPGTGEHLVAFSTLHTYRGASFLSSPPLLGVATRQFGEGGPRSDIGVRPSRALDPPTDP